MSFFSTLYLVAWILFIWIETSTSNIVRRRLTKHEVELNLHKGEDFPDILPVILKAPGEVVTFNFSKREMNYNVPVYVPEKDTKKLVIMDTAPIKNAAFYEDQSYDASITLHCKGHGASPRTQNACSIRLMEIRYVVPEQHHEEKSGFFHLDGHKHVIEPEKRDSKRVTLMASQNPNNQFVQKHRVYKLTGHNHSCNVKQSRHFPKRISNRTVTSGHNRFKRSKPKYIIEVVALITRKEIMTDEEIDHMKIYYTHVFWGVNMLYNNINSSEASFGLNLIGFVVKPESTELYQFANGGKGDFLNGTLSLHNLANYKDLPAADHVVMFSVHNISDNPSTVGLANVGAMCNAESVSLCRTLKSFEEIHVVAHEIGHSLGSYHDGQNNDCLGSNGYIMAATTISFPSKQQKLNGYQFSRCSINDISSFVSKLKPNCLLHTIKPVIIPSKPTGQLYPPRAQCRTSSRSSGICSTLYNRNSSEICLSLICRKDENLCKSVVPAYKTTCGNKKWCIQGECVYDDKAPVADEKCLFGDDENLKFTIKYQNGDEYRPKSCTDIISRVPKFCSVASQKVYCCSTCKKLETPDMRTSPSWSWPSSSYPSTYPSSSSSSLSSSSLLSVTSLAWTWTWPPSPTTTTSANLLAAASIANSKSFPVALAILHIFQLEAYFDLH